MHFYDDMVSMIEVLHNTRAHTLTDAFYALTQQPLPTGVDSDSENDADKADSEGKEGDDEDEPAESSSSDDDGADADDESEPQPKRRISKDRPIHTTTRPRRTAHDGAVARRLQQRDLEQYHL